MPRGFILVMDSFGIGSAPDAARFGDAGADTHGHIRAACAAGRADKAGLRQGPLAVPNLDRLGLAAAAGVARGEKSVASSACYGAAAERSKGKDTPSGHWEMAGVPVLTDWGYFPKKQPCFPAELTRALIREADLPGLLGDRHASGTQIIEELGAEHVASGKPIVYTSADSVFQIAAHEQHFGLERLYAVGLVARRLVDRWNIGRVIARPFVGEPNAFRRTGNRRDYATPPPEPTLLDRLKASGREVLSVGKVSDIFAAQGITRKVKADGNAALMQATMDAARDAPDGALVFTNFVDFDTLYGHRRDVAGYAAALEAFDRELPALERALRPGDLAIITADHGCDPTWEGTDHTREFVPVIAFGPASRPAAIGRRDSFADIGQTLARHLGLAPLPYGRAFL
ncbi:MAG: phosphopentomutase [Alphaproteobacteria bacterium]|nr:phosphopentomutase [Alphaproteobacteria bacterium]